MSVVSISYRITQWWLIVALRIIRLEGIAQSCANTIWKKHIKVLYKKFIILIYIYIKLSVENSENT